MPPRWRLLLLLLGVVALAFGIGGGLARLTPFGFPLMAVSLHGPLMVSAFLGTVISLERAAALDRTWAYAAPLLAGSGGILVLAGLVMAGFAAMALAAAVFLAASAVLMQRQPSLEAATRLAGAGAWLAGNLMLFEGQAAVPWWIAFFALTIGAEGAERSREPGRSPAARRAFAVIAAALLVSPVVPPALGAVLVLLACWMFAFDPARVALRQPGLPRYAAACSLAGVFWLAVGGVLIAAAYAYDAAMHAVFVGFVFSMLFGHAPVVLAALLGLRLPFSAFFYVPFIVLQASLAVRVALSAEIGAWGNALAIALFLGAAFSRAWSGRRRPTAPGR